MPLTNFEDIVQFHINFRLTTGNSPTLMTDDLFRFRVKFLDEELAEFHEAHINGDLVRAADSLVDLVYVALGTAYLMGVPWQSIWDVVHAANMQKVRADHNNPSKRNQPAFDIVKPPGWIHPEDAIKEILRVYGGRV